MKAGSKVHEKLEEEVYTSVPVTVQTKEEGWGLRIWNVLAGLKTLRETGMTRELEVWGVLEGEVVGGVIDQVSFSCTDQELEAKLQSATDGKPPQEQEAPALEEGQQPLSSFLKSSAGGQTMAEALDIPSLHPRLPTSPATPSNLLYITDVKTRSAPSLPRGASFVPTKLQLMLYHRMLSQMISGFEFSLVARHYELDMHAPFSDEFIAQLASIDADLNLILSHKSLSGLWSLVRPAFAAVSRSPGQPVHVSKVLCAEYRDARTGDLRGTTTITYDEKLLDRYLKHEMGYWQGQRKPVGVEISDAWKCGVCEFAADCDWRKDRELEFRSRGRGRGYAYKRS